ncbi:MAG: phosphotransferase [Anaerolineales bacterium]|jgi:thiamine kinase-like enzyme
MTPSIQEVIERIPTWRGREVAFQLLGGGLTNTNYRVEVDGSPCVVRIPGASTELLAVDRNNEYFNTKAAAQAGVGPKVLYYLPQDCVMVLEFIPGTTMSNLALRSPGMPGRIAQSLLRLHAGPRFLTDFNMFRLVEFYLRMAREHEVQVPAGYPQERPTFERIEQAVRAHALPSLPCHNDLLAENYIDDGQGLRLIDFEYSGNNDPCFELGNTCQELGYSEVQFAQLCRAYFGEAHRFQLARMHLYALMSDVGWTLWGAIQAKVSKLDYDFWGYCQTRWERALQVIHSAPFGDWLEQAAGRD